jgi:hypothetical protein
MSSASFERPIVKSPWEHRHQRLRPCFVPLAVGCLIGFVMPLAAAAQEVTIRPNLRAGDRFTLEIARSREDSSRPQQNAKSRALVNVEVVSATPAGLVLDWSAAEPAGTAPTVTDPVVAAAERALRGLRFRLVLDADGQFTGLANESEVLLKLESAIRAMTDGLAAQVPPAEREAFRKFMVQVLTSDTLLSSALRDVTTYFGLNGVALQVGETLESDVEMPSPLGGGALPAHVEIVMHSATPEIATLKITTRFAPSAIGQLVQGMYQQLGRPAPAQALDAMGAVEFGDEGGYTYERATGLMRAVAVTRTVLVGQLRRVDRLDIRLAAPPPR